MMQGAQIRCSVTAWKGGMRWEMGGRCKREGTYVYLWASQVAQWERICLQCRRCRIDLWVGKIPWRRKWQPTPVFLSGESHGQKSLMGYMGLQRVGHDLLTEHIDIYPFSLEPLSHLPPHPTPLDCNRAPDLSSLHHIVNSHWLSNFTYGNVYVSMLLSQFTLPHHHVQKCP